MVGISEQEKNKVTGGSFLVVGRQNSFSLFTFPRRKITFSGRKTLFGYITYTSELARLKLANCARKAEYTSCQKLAPLNGNI